MCACMSAEVLAGMRRHMSARMHARAITCVRMHVSVRMHVTCSSRRAHVHACAQVLARATTRKVRMSCMRACLCARACLCPGAACSPMLAVYSPTSV